MTNVLIQPCASPVARRNWQKTVTQQVPFATAPYASTLTPPELQRLTELHPSRQAMFWGRTRVHDNTMSSVQTGDVVLFTWDKHIRAIGTVGTYFRNNEFGDLLWREHRDDEHYPNVFSLINVADVALPYSVLWNVPGIKHGDIFRKGRVITNWQLSDDILEAIGVHTDESDNLESKLEEAVDEALQSNTTLPLETMHKTRTDYQSPGRKVRVEYAEGKLVQEYNRAHPHIDFVRVRSSAGMTDLQFTSEESELIEAKGSNTRKRVREAVAQLLHYAPENEHDLDRLTALFPMSPANADIQYLHRLGIDCVYRTGPELFHREPAPLLHRQHMRQVWNNKLER